MNDDLSLFTSEQLLQELLARPTFAAVVIHSLEEVRTPKPHNMWQVSLTSNLNLEQAHFLLSGSAERIKPVI